MLALIIMRKIDNFQNPLGITFVNIIHEIDNFESK